MAEVFWARDKEGRDVSWPEGDCVLIGATILELFWTNELDWFIGGSSVLGIKRAELFRAEISCWEVG